MSGRARTDARARRRFTEHLQKSLSCVSPAVWRTTGEGETEALIIASAPVQLGTADNRRAYLVAGLQYTFKTVDGDHRVKTEGYRYTIGRTPDLSEEVASWHWHPRSVPRPHVHVGGEAKRLHIPTGRVSFEAVVRFAIEDLAVRPLRPDWQTTLDAEEDLLVEYRTWA